MAPAAGSVPARDQRARRAGRRRRPRALDQAGGERGGGGIDGGVADPPVPGGSMSTEQVQPVVTADDLRPVDLFDDLDGSELAEWAAVAEPRSAQPGEVVISGDGPAAGLWCLLEGTLQTFLRDGERLEPVGHQNAPTWIGAVPTLTETSITARMVALTAARLVLIPAPEFRRLALAQPAVHRRIMLQVRPVLARATAMQQNHERLAALGTMAAGLAHELNNP